MPPYKAPVVRRKQTRHTVKRPARHGTAQGSALGHIAGARTAHPLVRAAPRVTRAQAKQRQAEFRGSQHAYHSQDRNPAQVIHKRRTQAKQKSAYRQAARHYKAYTEQLWGKAGRYYPTGKQPKTRPTPLRLNSRGDLSYGPGLAYVMRGERAVHVTPTTVYGLTSPDRRLRDYAHSVPLHEWAHVFQSAATQRQPKWVVEGAAEALEQLLAPRVGLRSSTNSRYAPWARQVRRRGRNYVLREQLGDY